jgi:nucleotide-binding universal stress UspA family protein
MAMDALYRTYEQAVKREEAASSAAFQAALAGKRCTSEWRGVDGFAEENLTLAARYADLVVLGQSDPEPMPEATPGNLPEMVALHGERPILVVPHIGAAQPPGRTVMVCWNGRREASRAAAGALPILKTAQRVVVLTIDPEKGEGPDIGQQAGEWLGRHGVKVTVQRDTATATDTGNVILSRAADAAADLIVMGIYGHSRMRQFVLGGVSRTLLASMTVPLLIAH